MKREMLAWGFAVAGVVAAGALTARAKALSERVAELEAAAKAAPKAAPAPSAPPAELAEARAESERLRAEVAEVRSALAAAEEKASAVPAPAAAAAPAPAKKKGGQFKEMMAMHRKMMDDPVFQEQMREGMKMQVGQMYGELLDGMGLQGEARDRAVAALADRLSIQAEIGMMLMDDEVTEEEILARQEASFAKAEAAVAAAFPGDGASRLETYDRELPDRMQRRQADQELAPLGLDPMVQDQVRSAILEERRGAQAELSMGFGGPGGGDAFNRRMTLEEIRSARSAQTRMHDPSAMLKNMAESRERTYARVRPLMTQEQFERYRKQQENQARMMEMGLQMMGGGGE